MLNDLPPKNNASIDQWIDWLALQRQQHPQRELASILDPENIESSRLLDLACVDLIEQSRRGVKIGTEDYVRQFPGLADHASQLDLIDAELCVMRELGKAVSVERFCKRFPEVANEIRELVQLEPAWNSGASSEKTMAGSIGGDVANESADAEFSIAVSDPTDSGSRDFSIVESPENLRLKQPAGNTAAGGSDWSLSPANHSGGESNSNTLGHLQSPIGPPPWLTATHCLESGKHRWLMRGRDSSSGENLAMKVIRLPTMLAPGDRKRMLDICEQASRVNHPVWVLPRVAAIESNCLAVIRPWIFGASGEEEMAIRSAVPTQVSAASEGKRRTDEMTRSISRRLRQLSSAAYALAAAHRVNAVHGGVTECNLLVDHDGEVRLVDASSTRWGWQRWMAHWEDDDETLLAFQKRGDVDDLLKLVAADASLLSLPGAGNWIGMLAKVSGLAPSGLAQRKATLSNASPATMGESPAALGVSPAAVGDELMKGADSLDDLGRLTISKSKHHAGESEGNWFTRWFRND